MFLEFKLSMKKFPLGELLSVIKYPVLFLAIIWTLFFIDHHWNLDLYQLGVNPRTILGLRGILFAPLIHGDINHILNNSLPVFILGSMIFYFYKPIAWSSIFWIYLISGLWLWVGGRNNDVIPNYHIGASTLIYGFSTFLFFSGVFRKHKQLMMVSAFVVFTYGSITWGIFPIDRTMSWEGHLFGSISGILVAYSYRKDGPQPIAYQWPVEERDLEAEYNEQLELEKRIEEQTALQMQVDIQNDKPSLDPFQIVYHYKESEESKPTEPKE